MSNCAVQALKDRRSIRAYDPERQVPEELLQEILQVAINSPTAHNKQKYHFTVVQQPELLEHMAHPHAENPPAPWREQRDDWPLRLLGAALLVGGTLLGISGGLTDVAQAWPAWLMGAGGLYLVVRR